MDKTTLMNTIQSEYAKLETLIAPLSEAQLSNEPADGEWSIKDIMAHVAAWEQICARWLEEFQRGITPRPTERVEIGSNERIYREYHDLSLAQVREFFQEAHQQFLQQVNQLTQAMSEEDLNASGRYAWTKDWPGYSLIAVIADNSYEHYQDHVQQIRRQLGNV